MNDEREWFSAEAGRKITATEMADMLNVARNTMNRRLREGLSADDVIAIARSLNLSPVSALIELGHLTYVEAHQFLEGGETLLGTATESELAIELTQRLASVRDIRQAFGTRHLGRQLAHLVPTEPSEELSVAFEDEVDETTEDDYTP